MSFYILSLILQHDTQVKTVWKTQLVQDIGCELAQHKLYRFECVCPSLNIFENLTGMPLCQR